MTVLGGVLSLHFHEDGAKFWSTQLLNVLQSFSLIKILSLDCSESYTLTKKMNKTCTFLKAQYFNRQGTHYQFSRTVILSKNEYVSE